MKILVTGTLGFIFSNFIAKACIDNPSWSIVGVDKAVKDYNLDNWWQHDNYRFYLADIADAHTMDRIFRLEQPDVVIGGAAESFVDNSITDIMPFLHSNVIGTQTLINACLKYKVERYIHISTDEVYGQQQSRDSKPWVETDPLQPRNPYAASKAAAEHIVIAAHNTHGLQYNITRSCNVFGPNQKRENLVPHIITSLSNQAAVRIHGTGLNFRQYIHVRDKVSAILTILDRGQPNTTYNIGDNNYYSNLEMVDNIARIMGTQPAIAYIPDRKAHDFGYSVNSDRLRNLGWQPRRSFIQALEATISSYVDR